MPTWHTGSLQAAGLGGVPSNHLLEIILTLPGPPKYVEEWPFGLNLGDLGHYFTYFGGLGKPLTSKHCQSLNP